MFDVCKPAFTKYMMVMKVKYIRIMAESTLENVEPML